MIRLLTVLCIFAVSAPSFCEDGIQQLFNGKNLTGWNGDPSLWTVEDGCITGTTNGPDHLKYNKFLIWDGTAADFEFRCEFRLEGQNNSGVQYRSEAVGNPNDCVLRGYQADLHPKQEFFGMLYGEKFGKRGIIAKRGQRVNAKGDKDVDDA